jgi:hypothetical protein
MGMGFLMQHEDTCHKHARILSPDGDTKISESSTVMLCLDTNVRVLECLYQQN